MTVRILPSAMKDLEEGFRYYEDQGEGLGAYFRESLFSDIESLKVYAGIHRTVFGCHRCLSKRFPWFIYYVRDAEMVFVKAILDCRRDPAKTRGRLT